MIIIGLEKQSTISALKGQSSFNDNNGIAMFWMEIFMKFASSKYSQECNIFVK